jgi:hypothetical protein
MVIQLLPAGGGVKLNIDYGTNPPSDTTKLWVPLATKPDAVECSPVLEYGSEAITSYGSIGTLTSPAPGYQNCLVGDWIYFLGPFLYDAKNTYTSKEIRRYNVKTLELETVQVVNASTVQSYGYQQMCGCAVNGVVCFFGGVYHVGDWSQSSRIFCYDTNTKEYTEIRSTSLSPTSNYSCCAVGDKIFLFGGYNYPASQYSKSAYVFDTVSKTLQPISTAPADGCSCCAVGGKIYTIGGRTTYNEVWVLDTTKLTWEKKNVTAPNNYTELTPSVAFGNKIYLFGNSVSSNTTSLKVTVYDTETDTFTETGKSMNGGANGTCFGSDGLNVYFIGGIGKYNTNSKQLQKFSFETPLTSNHLFLQEDYGYDGLWTALKSKDTDFKVKVINAYLGDSNNIAQLTNAYLYDSKDLKWKSLSGESYVADMQNALNILGVN